MTAFVANTRVEVLRGGATDVWGDDTGAGGSSVAAGLPAAVAEDRQRSYLASEQRGGVVEFYTVRLRPGVDVREGDRLVDETGATYVVEAVSDPPGVVGRADVRCTTRRTAATSTP